MMNVEVFIRGTAYAVFAIALLATAIALHNRQAAPANDLQVQLSTSVDGLGAELARCRALGAEAGDDAACKTAWQANRARFFNSDGIYPEHVTDPAAAASNPNASTPALDGPWPKSAPAPAKRAGHL
jgi:conjugative transfer region protein TrbK